MSVADLVTGAGLKDGPDLAIIVDLTSGADLTTGGIVMIVVDLTMTDVMEDNSRTIRSTQLTGSPRRLPVFISGFAS
jgi:hypothetical protein